MSVLTRPTVPSLGVSELLGSALASPAGPVETLDGLLEPPAVRLPRAAQTIWFSQRHASFAFHHRQRLGDVWLTDAAYVAGQTASISHPDHVRSLYTADPAIMPSLGEESPVRPPLGPNSLLTTNGKRHLRDRKLLLPPFHGAAIARYQQMIEQATEHEIARWPTNKPFALAPRMQAITLDVIMAGVLGIEGRPKPGSLEQALRAAIKTLLWASIQPGLRLAELINLGHDEPYGITWAVLQIPDRLVYTLLRKRRSEPDLEQRTDILSLIMQARTEDGRPLNDRELRDQLMTLILAGHETTANQLAWTWERLVRHPAALHALTAAVRGSDRAYAEDIIEATITEAARSRPVVPLHGRRTAVPWQFGQYGIPAGTAIGISSLLLHHREDLYPDPFSFRPERWIGPERPADPDATGPAPRRFIKPGTYDWIPFGGGTRRCIGAALAMAQMRVVLREMALRLDLQPTRQRSERPIHRNVTMSPANGARISVTRKH